MTDETEIGSQRSAVKDPSSVLRRPSSSNASSAFGPPSSAISPPTLRVSLLTGGGDKPYALGLAEALTSAGISVDFIGSDDLSVPELLNNSGINFLNLRGDQRPEASTTAKAFRVALYYAKLICYAAGARPKLFHILWHNKCQLFDRTLLLLYYRLLGKRIVFTAHNVNAGKRDLNDTWLNRLSLKVQYALVDHIFVHTDKMKCGLVDEFQIPERKVSVIPFGINNTVPNTRLTSEEAKRRLGLGNNDKTMLFFGNIAPYKGLEYLVEAFAELSQSDASYRLLIVGKPKGAEGYWKQIQEEMTRLDIRGRVIEKIEYVPDETAELYFKAADVLILPYVRVFQSGVLFLGYSFGLPVIAADVGSLTDEIVEGKTGFVFSVKDSSDLALKIDQYFRSDLSRNLETRRAEIKRYANERYSWARVAATTTAVYFQSSDV